MTSPTQRTLRELRERGYLPAMVEYWNHYARQRRDLFGCDVLAVGPDHVLMVQTTTADNLAARVTKLLALPSTPKLLAAGVRVEAWGWGTFRSRERTAEGKRSRRAQVRLVARSIRLGEGGGLQVVNIGGEPDPVGLAPLLPSARPLSHPDPSGAAEAKAEAS